MPNDHQYRNNILAIQNSEINAFAVAILLLFRMGITRNGNGISFMF